MQFLKQNSLKRAVAYYRHSAEDKQENSVPIQREHAQKFAAQEGIEIIHEETDEGVSGLTANRPGFKRLFKDWVEDPQAPVYDFIIVYDVSRWGRFQNPNEAAYYEHICEKHKRKVVYVYEGFARKGEEFTQGIIINVKRSMASNFSRELSSKVWDGCMRISRDGYSAGGTACYGMGRQLLDLNKQPIRILKKGEQKQISNERVRFVPLNDETTETVKEIFALFDKGREAVTIVRVLNDKGIKAPNGGKWKRSKIIHILSNETYIGTRLYNKTSSKLKKPTINNPRSEWAIAPNASDAIVEPEVFWRIQERLFWSTPSKWKRGIYRRNKVRKFVEQEIKTLLLSQGLNEDEVEQKLKTTPITYSVSFYEDKVPYRCFQIIERVRDFDYVFAISVSLYDREPIDKIFFIPTTEFNKNNFAIFSEQDTRYSQYAIEGNQIEEKVLSLIKK